MSRPGYRGGFPLTRPPAADYEAESLLSLWSEDVLRFRERTLRDALGREGSGQPASRPTRNRSQSSRAQVHAQSASESRHEPHQKGLQRYRPPLYGGGKRGQHKGRSAPSVPGHAHGRGA